MPERPKGIHKLHQDFVGDILLVFQSGQEVFPCRMGPREWRTEAEHDSWKLLVQSPGNQWKGFPCRLTKKHQCHFWLLGEIYGDLKELQNQDALVFEIVHGRRLASLLNGHFLLFAWDAETQTWHVLTDRFDTLHAYYANNGQEAALGTFFPATAAAASRRKLDCRGLLGFFSFGFFPQDRTHYEDVRILRPASHYRFDQTGTLLGHSRYWQWWHEPDLERPYDETVAEFSRLFSEVIRDHTQGGRIAIPISGGLDSRSTVAALPDEGDSSRFWAYSYGYGRDSVETRIARRIARTRGLSFKEFDIHPYLFDRLDLVADSIEGFQDLTQCRQAAVMDDLADADYVMAAHWGDVWLDDMGLVDGKGASLTRDAFVEYALHKMQKSGSEWLQNNFRLSPGDGALPDDCLREMIRQEITGLQNLADADFRLKAFKTDQWSFRWTTASLRMFQAAAFPRLPFYDVRLTDFFATVPSEFVQNRRLQVDYLKRYAPDLARVTWQAYDASLFGYQHIHTWLVPKRAVKKAWRLLMGKTVVERNWEVQFLNPTGRRGLEHWLVRPGLRLHDFFHPSDVSGLLENFFADPLSQSRGYTISMLLTFSVWLERYS